MINDTILGIVATCFTTAAFLPQVVKVVRSDNTKSIALLFILIKMTGSFLWAIYGIMINNAIVIISCNILLILTAIICGYKIKNVIKYKESY